MAYIGDRGAYIQGCLWNMNYSVVVAKTSEQTLGCCRRLLQIEKLIYGSRQTESEQFIVFHLILQGTGIYVYKKKL